MVSLIYVLIDYSAGTALPSKSFVFCLVLEAFSFKFLLASIPMLIGLADINMTTNNKNMQIPITK